MVESIGRAPSKESNLSHAAPEEFAEPPRSNDEIIRSDNTGTHRSTYGMP